MARTMVRWPTADELPAGGVKDDIRIERFRVSESEAEFSRLRAAIGNPGSAVDPGVYVRLLVGGWIMMSNTPTELMESREAVLHAHGRVLIGGLGLGVILHPILEKESVEHVTVVEINPGIIDLVTPSLRRWIDSGKLSIVCADMRTWKPVRGTRYQCVWIDIWESICADDLPEALALKRKFRRRLEQGEGGHSPWISTWLDAASYRMRA